MSFFYRMKDFLKIPPILTGYDDELFNIIKQILLDLSPSYILESINDDPVFQIPNGVSSNIIERYTILKLAERYKPPTGIFGKEALQAEISEIENLLKTE